MKKLLSIFLLITFITNCSFNNEESVLVEIEEDFSSIENPKQRWEAYNLQDYYLKQSWQCYCTPPYGAEIYVKGNNLIDFKYISTHDATDNDIKYAESLIVTVHDAFDLIDEYKDTADSIRVVYHPKFGYPTELELNPSFAIADDEISYFFTGLKKVLSF